MRFLSVILIVPFLIAALEIDIGNVEQTFHDEYDHYVINQVHIYAPLSLDKKAPLKLSFGFAAAICPNPSFSPIGFSHIDMAFGEVPNPNSKLFILFRSLLI